VTERIYLAIILLSVGEEVTAGGRGSGYGLRLARASGRYQLKPEGILLL
jgi:hypothetical protein